MQSGTWCFALHNGILACGLLDGDITLLNTQNWQKLGNLKGHTNYVSSLVVI